MGNPMPEQLAPTILNDMVAELVLENTAIQDILGSPRAADGGRAVGGRNFAWDILDPTREVAEGRMPGTAPSTVKDQPTGLVSGRFPRVHESLPLLYEQLINQRKIGSIEIDSRGEYYIAEQAKRLAQRVANHIEMQSVAMLRGGLYYLTQSGDSLVPSLDSGSITIDYQVPSGNKLIGGSFAAGLAPMGTNRITATWATASNNIATMLYLIDADMQALTGYRLADIVIPANVWNNVLLNTSIKELAGTASSPFEYVERQVAGKPSFVARLKGLPWINWHICNQVLNFNGTATQLIPDSYACFLPERSTNWLEYWNGSEMVVRWPGDSPVEAFGQYFYAAPSAHPAGWTLYSVHNGIWALKNPKAIMYARVQ